MFKAALYTLLVWGLSLATGCGSTAEAGPKTKSKITIETPAAGANVASPLVLKGDITEYTGGHLVALVHPLATPLYYVQRWPSAPNPSGRFQTLCYLGTKSGAGLNEDFELVVILAKKPIEEGSTLKALPESLAQSEIITVTRVK